MRVYAYLLYVNKHLRIFNKSCFTFLSNNMDRIVICQYMLYNQVRISAEINNADLSKLRVSGESQIDSRRKYQNNMHHLFCFFLLRESNQ